MQRLDELHPSVMPEPNSGCWLWVAGASGVGYGQVYIDRKPHSTHRVSYEQHRGAIPKGAYVLHKCHNRLCVNPEHLELGTHKKNMEHMAIAERTFGTRLTRERVERLRQLRAEGVTWENLAHDFGLPLSTVHAAGTGKTWRHV
jgi:hypothetical protein